MTFPQNTPSIDQLINLPAGEIAQLPVELLAALQREIDAAAKQMKAVTARFSTALEVRYAARAACDPAPSGCRGTWDPRRSAAGQRRCGRRAGFDHSWATAPALGAS